MDILTVLDYFSGQLYLFDIDGGEDAEDFLLDNDFDLNCVEYMVTSKNNFGILYNNEDVDIVSKLKSTKS